MTGRHRSANFEVRDANRAGSCPWQGLKKLFFLVPEGRLSGPGPGTHLRGGAAKETGCSVLTHLPSRGRAPGGKDWDPEHWPELIWPPRSNVPSQWIAEVSASEGTQGPSACMTLRNVRQMVTMMVNCTSNPGVTQSRLLFPEIIPFLDPKWPGVSAEHLLGFLYWRHHAN